MKLLLAGAMALLMVGMAGTARAVEVFDERAVARVVELKKANKAFNTKLPYYPDPQLVSFAVSTTTFRYLIDLRGRLCFARIEAATGYMPVPCKSLKLGYPLMAPLITWDD